MFASNSTAQAQDHDDDDDDDDDDDEEDFLQARRNLKGRSAAAGEQKQPARRSLPSREETSKPRPNISSMSSAPPHASGTKAEDEMNSDDEAEARSESTSDEDMAAEQEKADCAAHAETEHLIDASPSAVLALPEEATAHNDRFVAQPPAHPLPSSGGCTFVVHREVTPAQSAQERNERGARVDALAASRRTLTDPPEAAEAPGGGGALADASVLPSTSSLTPPAEAQVVVQGVLFDRLIAQEPPLAALPEDAALLAVASELYLLRVELPPADLLQLPVVVAEVITAFPFSALQHGEGATTPRLVGLQFAATPPVPAVVALVRGNPHSLMSASWRSAHPAFGSSTARLAEPADILSFSQPASSTLALVATPGCADGALAEDLKAPPLPRTVLAVKEHALRNTDAVLSSLTDAGLAVVGVRLIYLATQLGSAAQLGLDSPLVPSAILVLLVEGYDVCDRVQALAGAADSKLARKTDVGSLRAKFGVDRVLNVVSTPRHIKGAQRAASFFFGPHAPSDASAGLSDVHFSFCQAREPTIVVCDSTSETSHVAATRVLQCMQRAGFALHTGARASGDQLDALELAPRSEAVQAGALVFLLSFAGPSAAVGAAALQQAMQEEAASPKEAAGLVVRAELHDCSSDVARQLLQETAGSSPLKTVGSSASITVDMFSYMLFALKSGLL